jgi:hypothetical protein
VDSLSLSIDNNNPVINLISKGSIHFVIKTLSQLRDKEIRGFEAQLSRLVEEKNKQEIWAEIEAASLLAKVCEVEFFERLKSAVGKIPDLRCNKTFTYYVEVYLPRQNEVFSRLEEMERRSGMRVVSASSVSKKFPHEFLYDRIRDKYQQFENYNPGMIYADFTFAGNFFCDKDSFRVALSKIFEKKLKEPTSLSRHLIGMFCTRLISGRDRYFFYDDEDERCVKLNTELLGLFDERNNT